MVKSFSNLNDGWEFDIYDINLKSPYTFYAHMKTLKLSGVGFIFTTKDNSLLVCTIDDAHAACQAHRLGYNLNIATVTLDKRIRLNLLKGFEEVDENYFVTVCGSKVMYKNETLDTRVNEKETSGKYGCEGYDVTDKNNQDVFALASEVEIKLDKYISKLLRKSYKESLTK